MRWLFVTFLFFFLSIGCSGTESSATAPPSSQTAGLDAGGTDFTLTNLDGDETSLSDLRGEYVLVNFWATWCIPCRKEMPYLQELADKHEGDLTILGVNMNEDAERVGSFIEEEGFTFPILLDPPDDLKREHRVQSLPVTFVVDRDGEVVYRKIGEVFPEEFDSWLAENLP